MNYKRFFVGLIFLISIQSLITLAQSDEPSEQQVEEAQEEPKFNPLSQAQGGLQTLFLPGPVVYDPHYGDFTKQNRIYVGAGTSGMRDYAITSFVPNRQAAPMIPEKVVVNNSGTPVDHPIYNQKVNCIALSGQSFAAVTERDNNQVSVIFNWGAAPTFVYQSVPLKDLHGNSDGVHITNIAIGATGMDDHALRQFVIAAIKDKQGYDSLALVKMDMRDVVATTTDEQGAVIKEETLIEARANVLNAITGASDENMPLDLKPYISTFGECESYEITSLCWEQLVERFYITLRVTNSRSIDNQASWTVLMAKVMNDGLVIEPCMPVPYAKQADAGFLACEKGETAYFNKVVSHTPSLGGIYLLLQKEDQLYSFPLINKSKKILKEFPGETRSRVMKDEEHGTLARKNASLHEYHFRNTKTVVERYFEEIIEGEEPGLFASDIATKVGGAGSLPGPIESIEFAGDAVLVSIKRTWNDLQLAGLFLSCPIFNQDGAVAGWSSWERVAQSKQPTVYGCFDCENNVYVALEYMIGTDNQLYGKVRMSAWENCKKSESGDPFIAMLNRQFSQDKEGIASMNVYDGMTIVVGHSSIMIADVGSEMVATNTDVKVGESHDGTFDWKSSDNSVSAIQVSGGDLGTDPYLVSSAVIHDGNQYWLCCAGTQGVFIASQPDGSGVASLRDYCTDAGRSVRFKKIADFSRVKKVIADRDYLYVLTSRAVYKYSLKTGSYVTVASSHEMDSGLFNDFIVSGDLALMAAVNGLYRVAPGNSIYSAVSSHELDWEKVVLLHNEFPIKKFFVITPTGYETDFGLCGQVYAVASSANSQQSTTYRLFCSYDSSRGVVAESVGLTPDYLQKDNPLGLISCGTYRDGIYTNGAMVITYQSRMNKANATVEFAGSHLKSRSGVYMRNLGRSQISSGIKHAHSINGICLEPITGRLVLYGDFGARVHK
jgi:hypothetical protein